MVYAPDSGKGPPPGPLPPTATRSTPPGRILRHSSPGRPSGPLCLVGFLLPVVSQRIHQMQWCGFRILPQEPRRFCVQSSFFRLTTYRIDPGPLNLSGTVWVGSGDNSFSQAPTDTIPRPPPPTRSVERRGPIGLDCPAAFSRSQGRDKNSLGLSQWFEPWKSFCLCLVFLCR